MCVWGHVCIPPVCTSLAHRCLSDWVWAQVPSFVHMPGGPSKHVLVCVCMSPSVLVCPGPEDGFVGLCVLRATCEACICTRKPQHRYTYVCVGECMVSICLGLNGYEWLYVCVTWGPCILRCPLAHVGFRNGRLGSSGSRAGERQRRRQIRPFLHPCAGLCAHTGSVCAQDTQVHKRTCSEVTLVVPAHTLWAGPGG